MVKTYWEIGRLIFEEFGKGFTTRNLLNMPAFYLQNPIWHSVSTKLTWTHHRILLRVQDSKAREWYAQEAIENAWTVRALDRQIDKLYYERLLSSKNKQPVVDEATIHTDALKDSPERFSGWVLYTCIEIPFLKMRDKYFKTSATPLTTLNKPTHLDLNKKYLGWSANT